MKRALIFLLVTVFMVANVPIAFAQDNPSTSIPQQITQSVRDALRALDRLFQKSKEAAREAKLKQEQLQDLMTIRDDMKRMNEDRLKTTQQILKDQIQSGKNSRESALARQRDQQQTLKDRLRDLKK